MTEPRHIRADWTFQHRDNVGVHEPTHMLTDAARLDDQIAQMRAQGYIVHRIEVAEFCGTCLGTGRVYKRDSRGRPRPFQFRACPGECQGRTTDPLTVREHPIPAEVTRDDDD